MLFWFVICCILFVACLITFILVLSLAPKTKTNPPSVPLIDHRPGFPSGLGQSFVLSDGVLKLAEPSKPLSVSLTKDGPITNAFVFNNLEPIGFPLIVETNNTSRGFYFQVSVPVSVVGLQIIDQLFTSGVRVIGIYDVNANRLLYTTTISKTVDQLIQGFRTQTLAIRDQVPLVPGVLYACCAVVLVGDSYVQASDVAQPINIMKMAPFFSTEGEVGFVASNTLVLPTNFSSAFQLTSPFGSLQLQQKNFLQSVFDVDTQYARFPPRYINGLRVDVTDASSAIARPGFCSSVYDDGNILSQDQTLQVTLVAKAPNTWYAIYVADDSPVGTYNPQLIISENAAEIPDFRRQRRIGWARTKLLSSEFFTSEQEGSGVSRTTIYMEPADQITLSLANAVPVSFRLGLIPPTADRTQIQVTAVFAQPGPLPDTVFQITVESVFQGVPSFTVLTFIPQQSYQIQTMTIPVNSALIPASIRVRANFDGAGVPNPECTFSILQYVEDL